MKVTMLKLTGGMLAPATDAEEDRMKRFKTGSEYEIEIKEKRNGDFHRKVMKFLRFCFEHWRSEHAEIQDEGKQFDVFRDHITVLAGYYKQYYKLDGSVRIEADSISYADMSQEDFERYYSAIINVALRSIFKTTDSNTYNQLLSFF